MDRLTGTGALELKEAYNAIYAQQENEVELIEEQIQEDFENWVYSLVEEGHDLSEYTWEEMYESYLDEMGQPGGNVPGGRQSTTRGAVTMYSSPRSNTGQPYQSRFARPMNANTPQSTGRGTSLSRPQIGGMGGLGAGYRGAELQQAARARASQVGTSRQGTAGGPTVSGNTPIGPAATTRPAAPARLSAAPARPTAARPTASPRPTPSAQPSIAQSYSMRPGAVASAPRTGTTTTIPQSTGSPVQGYQTAVAQRPSLAQQAAELRAMRQRSQQRQGLTQSFDPFDIVMGHLIDEGYADTEEAALQIMTNMSEEWREEILDEGFKRMNRDKIEKQAQRLGGDKGNVLRNVAARMDTDAERKYSTRQARRNRAGGAGSEYRKTKELQARDDAKSDIEKYGFH